MLAPPEAIRDLSTRQDDSWEVAMHNRVLALGILVAVSALGMSPAEAKQKSLFDRLGGQSAIVAVVDDLVTNVVGDKRINAFFANTEPTAFKAKLVDFLCQATGGPCKYAGLDVKSAHKGRGIKDADFNALVEDLGKSLDTLKVAKKDKKALIGLLAPMKKDIVEN